MTQSPLEASGLAERISLLEETGSLAGVRFYSCVDSISGVEYEAARWEFGAHSGESVRAIIDGLQKCQSLDFEGIQRPIAYESSDDGLLVVSEALKDRDAIPTGGIGAPPATERTFHIALELSRIVAYLHSAGVPISVLPATSVAEVPMRGMVLRYPWLLAALSDLVPEADESWPELAAALPPEVVGGRTPTARAGVYAVSYLTLSILSRDATSGDGAASRPPMPPALEFVLKRGVHHNARKRFRDMRGLAAALEATRPGRRTHFSPAWRLPIPDRRKSVRLSRLRVSLPNRPVPESDRPKVRPWMVGAVIIIGIVAFLLVLPRIDNPLVPLEQTIEEIGAIFSADRSLSSPTEAAASSLVIPGEPFQIPDFRGRQQAEVQIEAEAMGLEIEVAEEFRSDVPAGAVIRQEPDPGTVITGDYRMTLFINRGDANAFLVSVVGDTAGEARDVLESLGFLVLEVPVFDEEKPPGEVVGQNPAGDQILSKGRQVILEVSRGPERIVIPSLVGLSEAGAVQRATDAGLNLRSEFEIEAPAGFPPGAVYAQEPAAGSLTEPEAEIVITVYRPEPVTVPRVIGMDPDEAFALLISSGLTVRSLVERESADATERTVVEQVPSSGIKVARESGISLIVERPALTPSPLPTATP
ncbi:MAG: PASTA domain-containing protein [Chloroflexi bacterium]|nr:PASTA domain-containing protein [Chloroflexota bacterium]